MRLVIRNKDKLIESFGEDYYNLLLESVKAYEYNSDDRQLEYRDWETMSQIGRAHV